MTSIKACKLRDILTKHLTAIGECSGARAYPFATQIMDELEAAGVTIETTLKTLTDMTPSERVECRGMWAQTPKGKEVIYFIREQKQPKTVDTHKPGSGENSYELNEVTPLPDLPRAWGEDGNPVERKIKGLTPTFVAVDELQNLSLQSLRTDVAQPKPQQGEWWLVKNLLRGEMVCQYWPGREFAWLTIDPEEPEGETDGALSHATTPIRRLHPAGGTQ